MRQLLARHRSIGLISWDVLCWVLALGWFALMRYDFEMDAAEWRGSATYVATAIVFQVVGGLATQIYLGRSRIGSFLDVSWLGGTVAVIGATLLVLASVLPIGAPRGALIALPALALMLMVSGRYAWRAYRELIRRRGGGGETPTLIYGAGELGHQIARQIVTSQDSPYSIVGFLDDNESKRLRRVEGHRVLGTGEDLVRVAREQGAAALVVAMAGASPALLREVRERCRQIGLAFAAVPPLHEMIGGRIRLDQLRDLDLSDLLGRRPVSTDLAAIAGYINGRRVLITGAGGSIGAELARQVHRLAPARVALLDRDESALHAVALSISGSGLLHTDETVLCDIRDYDALVGVFRAEQPDVVFHAAALKHLPVLERFPAEGFKTNVVGTANVLACAAEAGVTHFVNISTDKAADPSSVLGRTKRVAERMTAHFATQLDAPYVSVRFGNVLGSRGSVLDTFRAQIANGGPLTITHPDVTRYFMTIPEACELVLQAGAGGFSGDVLVLDMGDPVRIVDLATHLIAESGHDLAIKFTGLRPGEKLHEALFSSAEVGQPSHHPLIKRVQVPPLAPEVACADGPSGQAEPSTEPPDQARRWRKRRPSDEWPPAAPLAGGAAEASPQVSVITVTA
ncbi:MAG: polysaccharide biosynthesis protein [Bifidobacteriaceae bacterium]|jgi:dTDP-glucose 4,6-dehydratase|nr:polysaccharide biosynthesis protein [Bifidobacteriaceae bacterium]